jgi:hypothetical protein
MNNNNFKLKPFLKVSSLSIVLLAGCSTMGHKVDKDDVCYNQKSELLGAENYYAKSIVEGVLAGAATGAATGALTAALSGGDVGKAAAIGAASGAVVGGIGGYYMAKQKDIADTQALATSIRNDLLKETKEIDRATIAFAKLRDCRFSNAERIKSEYKQGLIKREEAINKLADLKQKFDDDIKLAEEIGSTMDKNLKEFQYSSDQMLAQDQDAKLAVDQLSQTSSEGTIDQLENTVSPSKAIGKKSKKTTKAPVKPKTIVSAKISKSPKVDLAMDTHSAQIKKKSYNETTASAKADRTTAFSLDAASKGKEMSFLMPEDMVCGI